MGVGGAAISTQEMASEIGRKNEVVVFTPSYGHAGEAEPNDVFRVVRYPNRFVPSGSIIQQKTFFFSEMTKHLSAFVREFKPDIIHAQGLLSAPAVAKVSEIHNIQGVAHVRDHRFECFTSRVKCSSHRDATILEFAQCIGKPMYSILYPYAKLVTRSIRHAVEYCGKAFTVSNYLRDELLRTVSLDVRMTYIGIDLAKARKIPAANHIAGVDFNSKKIIVYDGGFNPDKGIYELLEGFRLACPEVKNMVLLIAGKGPCPAKIHDYLHLNELKERVRLIGNVPHDQMVGIVKGSTLTIVPSQLPEAGSRSAVEALACGKPVLGSNTGCLPEIIGDAGTVFQPTARNIAQNLIRVLGDDDILCRLSKHARAKSNLFDINESNAIVSRAYREWLCR